MYRYIENYKPSIHEVNKLYSSLGWSSYTKDIENSFSGFNKSLFNICCLKDNILIAFIRVVGDGHTIIYVQDILVDPIHQNNGIGKKLLQMALDKYKNVRQKILLTDASKENKYVIDFYKSFGFETCDKGIVVAMAKFN